MPKTEFLNMVDGTKISTIPARNPLGESPKQQGDSASEAATAGAHEPDNTNPTNRDSYMNSSESPYAWARKIYGEPIKNDPESESENNTTNAKLPNSEKWQTRTSDPDEYAE